jgi:hypothetical protein
MVQRQGLGLNPLQQYVFNNVWKSAAPSKVIAFSWQLLINRIPTMDNLALRGFPADINGNCPLCNLNAETAEHLFLHCRVSAKIWYEILRWVDHSSMLPPTLLHSFALLSGCGSGKKGKKGMMLIWHTFVWLIWRARNNRIFNNGSIDADEVIESIKRLSWQWYIERMAKSPCLFYEWRWNPGDCFQR